MFNSVGLIPARFLTLTAHLCVCITLLWSSAESVKSCFHPNYERRSSWSQHSQLIIGLSVAVGMIGIEMFTFLIGLTMFNSASALLSTLCHGSATILLAYFVFDNWHCDWFWWIFAFCSMLPILKEIYVVFDVLWKRKY